MSALTRIPFAGGELLAVRGATPRETLVALKPIAERLGLDWSGQRAKLAAHPVLRTCMENISTQVGAQARDVVVLPLSKVPFWLAGIRPARIPNADTRALVIRYQTEAADVLYAHFFGQAAAPGTAPGIAASVAPGITASTAGGVVKGIVHKALGEHLAPVRAGMSEQQSAIAALAAQVDRLVTSVGGRVPNSTPAPSQAFNSALVFLIEAGWPQNGRRAMVNAVSSRLTWFSAQHGYQTRVTAERGIRLFEVAAIAAWRRAGGDAFLAGRRAQMSSGSGRAATGA